MGGGGETWSEVTGYSWEAGANGDVNRTSEMDEQDHLGPGGATQAWLWTNRSGEGPAL